jgi:hypothetical protein
MNHDLIRVALSTRGRLKSDFLSVTEPPQIFFVDAFGALHIQVLRIVTLRSATRQQNFVTSCNFFCEAGKR